MAKYLDYHETMPPMPPEAMQAVQEQIRSGKPDEFGVVPLAAMVGGGHAWCLTEAPSSDAVCQSHVAKGIPQDGGNVFEVQSLA